MHVIFTVNSLLRMKLIKSAFALFFLLFLFSGCKNKTSDELKPFLFMIGNWQSSNDSTTMLYENWKESEGKFIGESFAINQQGDTVFSEKAELFFDGKNIIYAVAAGDQKWVDFTHKDNQIDFATFENLSNDFPQRIIYSSTESNRLFAKIEGKVDGGIVREYFDYKKR